MTLTDFPACTAGTSGDTYRQAQDAHEAGVCSCFDPARDARVGSSESALDRLRGTLLHGAELLHVPPVEMLVDGMIQAGGTFAIYGPSGHGKTFVALDVALAVATGRGWHGHAVQPGRVLYVVGEGVAGFGARVTARCQHYALDEWGDVVWLPQAVNLFDRLAVGTFTQLAVELAPKLVVFDTLARCTVGADENSAKDMGLVVAHLDQVRTATGAAIGFVHHAGKNTTAGLRGSSALLGAMDTVISVVGPAEVEVTVEKQKNGPDGIRHLFRLQAVAASMVLVEIAPKSEELRENDYLMLAALDAIDLGNGVAHGAWSDASQVALRTFNRALKRLVGATYCHNVGTSKQPRYALTDKGRTALTTRVVP